MQISSVDRNYGNCRNKIEFEQPKIAYHCAPVTIKVFFNGATPPTLKWFFDFLITAGTSDGTELIGPSRHGGLLMNASEVIVWRVFIRVVGYFTAD